MQVTNKSTKLSKATTLRRLLLMAPSGSGTPSESQYIIAPKFALTPGP